MHESNNSVCSSAADAQERSSSVLDGVAWTLPNRLAPGELVVGTCVNASHPTLQGRVLVQWCGGGLSWERWLPTLQALTVRAGDTVLLGQPSNTAEPIVTGVVDGFSDRPKGPAAEAVRITVADDEKVCVATSRGMPLVEILPSSSGPIVRLASPDVRLDVPGTFQLAADSIELSAKRGEARIHASSDVVIRGEMIQLNS